MGLGMKGSRGESCTLAADVGGSGLKLAYGTTSGELSRSWTVPIGKLRRRGDVVEGIVAELRDAVAEAPPELHPRSVGLVIPGIVDEFAGVGRLSLILQWRDVPFRRLVSEATGLPVNVGHDVGAGAMAEGRLGAARGLSEWLFLALGTGLGSAFVLNGRPYRGVNGYGGELSHVVAVPNGPLCRCGKRGCLEMLASASAIATRYSESRGTGEAVTASEVIRRMRAGDGTAARIWSEAIAALAVVVAGCVESLNPSTIVIGGGLAEAGVLLFEPFTRSLLPQIRFVNPSPEIRSAQLGLFAGLYGAALLGLEAAELEVTVAGLRPTPHGADRGTAK